MFTSKPKFDENMARASLTDFLNLTNHKTGCSVGDIVTIDPRISNTGVSIDPEIPDNGKNTVFAVATTLSSFETKRLGNAKDVVLAYESKGKITFITLDRRILQHHPNPLSENCLLNEFVKDKSIGLLTFDKFVRPRKGVKIYTPSTTSTYSSYATEVNAPFIIMRESINDSRTLAICEAYDHIEKKVFRFEVEYYKLALAE